MLESKAFSLSARSALPVTVDNIAPGTVDARLDWDSAAADLNLYVTDTNCTSILDILGGRCRVITQAVSMTAKPERVTFANTTTANYIFWAHNISSAAESATMEVGLTR